MIYITNTYPKYCPNCGECRIPNDTSDFFAGASHTCMNCGTHYAYAPGHKILALASEVGDMGRYVDTSELED